jgi:integrase
VAPLIGFDGQNRYALVAFTGMRSGELQRLRLEDIDLTGNWIHIVSREGVETETGYPCHSG